LRSRVRGFEVLWSMPGVLRMEGDSACRLKAGRWLGMGAGGPSVAWPSGSMVAARAEKKPPPWGGMAVSASSENLLSGAGEAGAEGGPFRLGWLRTRPATVGGPGTGRD
jgi:hypothetical protein